jgi:hypothetical protein
MPKKQLVFIVLILVLLFAYSCVLAEDGRYEATVTMDSGIFSVPVEVYDGEVVRINWPNDEDMAISGAEINDGEATGFNLDGETVNIKLKDYHG